MDPIQTTKPNNKQPAEQEEQTYLDAYVKTFDEQELQAYHIAVEHLGMSFQLDKSIGYLTWKKEHVAT
jgi:hypothetical protein